MTLHHALLWPEKFDMSLWTFALEHVNYLRNRLSIGRIGTVPIDIYMVTKLDLSCLKNKHTWGCLAYVLDPLLQDGKQIPKWKSKARRGQHLGKSAKHARSVSLIRNFQTSYISP